MKTQGGWFSHSGLLWQDVNIEIAGKMTEGARGWAGVRGLLGYGTKGEIKYLNL